MDTLTYWANISAIGAFAVTFVGSVVGIWGYLDYRCKWRRKRKELVAYLFKAKKDAHPGKKGQQTILHLIRHVGLTEDEILKISFESKHVNRLVAPDDGGKAEVLLFEYVE